MTRAGTRSRSVREHRSSGSVGVVRYATRSVRERPAGTGSRKVPFAPVTALDVRIRGAPVRTSRLSSSDHRAGRRARQRAGQRQRAPAAPRQRAAPRTGEPRRQFAGVPGDARTRLVRGRDLHRPEGHRIGLGRVGHDKAHRVRAVDQLRRVDRQRAGRRRPARHRVPERLGAPAAVGVEDRRGHGTCRPPRRGRDTRPLPWSDAEKRHGSHAAERLRRVHQVARRRAGQGRVDRVGQIDLESVDGHVGRPAARTVARVAVDVEAPARGCRAATARRVAAPVLRASPRPVQVPPRVQQRSTMSSFASRRPRSGRACSSSSAAATRCATAGSRRSGPPRARVKVSVEAFAAPCSLTAVHSPRSRAADTSATGSRRG